MIQLINAPYINKLKEDLQLRGYAPSTHAQYIRTTEEFLALIGKEAGEITEEDVRAYSLRNL